MPSEEQEPPNDVLQSLFLNFQGNASAETEDLFFEST